MSACVLCDTTEGVQKRFIVPRHRGSDEGLIAKPICVRCHEQYHWRAGHQVQSRTGEVSTEAVERIIELRNEGLSYSRIAQVLNEWGVETARGGAWHPQTIVAIYEREAPVRVPTKPTRPHMARYGYTWNQGRFERDRYEQDVIAWIVSQREDGATYTAIAEGLRRAGVPAKRGGTWAGSQVANIYRREAR